MESIDTPVQVTTRTRALGAAIPLALVAACCFASPGRARAQTAVASSGAVAKVDGASARPTIAPTAPLAPSPRTRAANDEGEGASSSVSAPTGDDVPAEAEGTSSPQPTSASPAGSSASAAAPAAATGSASALSTHASLPPETLRAGDTGNGNGNVLPDWLRSIGIGGGAILWYFQPVDTGAVRNVDLFFANLLLDGKFGSVGLHIEPRFRDSRLRSFFPGPVWAQEAYASVRVGSVANGAVIKAGKEYSHFGLFWDNSFYGNVQVYDGLKLDPDYGLSLEGAVNGDAAAGVRYFAQYFIVDGQTNVSLAGRDTISVPNGGGYSRRRNQAILRVEPFVKATDALTFTAGASGAFLQAALPTGTKNVYRAAGDLTVAIPHAAFWGEYTYQNGQSVTDFPVAGAPATATTAAVAGHASAHNHYVLAGGQYSYQALTLRYNVSSGRYTDLSVSEWMHVPALAVAVGDNLTVLTEYVNWKRYTPGGSSLVDRSIDITINGHF